MNINRSIILVIINYILTNYKILIKKKIFINNINIYNIFKKLFININFVKKKNKNTFDINIFTKTGKNLMINYLSDNITIKNNFFLIPYSNYDKPIILYDSGKNKSIYNIKNYINNFNNTKRNNYNGYNWDDYITFSIINKYNKFINDDYYLQDILNSYYPKYNMNISNNYTNYLLPAYILNIINKKKITPIKSKPIKPKPIKSIKPVVDFNEIIAKKFIYDKLKKIIEIKGGTSTQFFKNKLDNLIKKRQEIINIIKKIEIIKNFIKNNNIINIAFNLVLEYYNNNRDIINLDILNKGNIIDLIKDKMIEQNIQKYWFWQKLYYNYIHRNHVKKRKDIVTELRTKKKNLKKLIESKNSKIQLFLNRNEVQKDIKETDKYYNNINKEYIEQFNSNINKKIKNDIEALENKKRKEFVQKHKEELMAKKFIIEQIQKINNDKNIGGSSAINEFKSKIEELNKKKEEIDNIILLTNKKREFINDDIYNEYINLILKYYNTLLEKIKYDILNKENIINLIKSNITKKNIKKNWWWVRIYKNYIHNANVKDRKKIIPNLKKKQDELKNLLTEVKTKMTELQKSRKIIKDMEYIEILFKSIVNDEDKKKFNEKIEEELKKKNKKLEDEKKIISDITEIKKNIYQKINKEKEKINTIYTNIDNIVKNIKNIADEKERIEDKKVGIEKRIENEKKRIKDKIERIENKNKRIENKNKRIEYHLDIINKILEENKSIIEENKSIIEENKSIIDKKIKIETDVKNIIKEMINIHEKKIASYSATIKNLQEKNKATILVDKISEEAERKAREEAEKKASEEAEKKAREEAERKETERKIKDAERKEQELKEAEKKAREETERKEAEKKEAEKKAREETERKLLIENILNIHNEIKSIIKRRIDIKTLPNCFNFTEKKTFSKVHSVSDYIYGNTYFKFKKGNIEKKNIKDLKRYKREIGLFKKEIEKNIFVITDEEFKFYNQLLDDAKKLQDEIKIEKKKIKDDNAKLLKYGICLSKNCEDYKNEKKTLGNIINENLTDTENKIEDKKKIIIIKCLMDIIEKINFYIEKERNKNKKIKLFLLRMKIILSCYYYINKLIWNKYKYLFYRYQKEDYDKINFEYKAYKKSYKIINFLNTATYNNFNFVKYLKEDSETLKIKSRLIGDNKSSCNNSPDNIECLFYIIIDVLSNIIEIQRLEKSENLESITFTSKNLLKYISTHDPISYERTNPLLESIQGLNRFYIFDLKKFLNLSEFIKNINKEEERKVREEAERKVREEAERKVREEAERKAKKEVERKFFNIIKEKEKFIEDEKNKINKDLEKAKKAYEKAKEDKKAAKAAKVAKAAKAAKKERNENREEKKKFFIDTIKEYNTKLNEYKNKLQDNTKLKNLINSIIERNKIQIKILKTENFLYYYKKKIRIKKIKDEKFKKIIISLLEIIKKINIVKESVQKSVSNKYLKFKNKYLKYKKKYLNLKKYNN